MEINNITKEMIKDPENTTVSIQVTDEAKERMKIMSKEIMDILTHKAVSPLEIYMVLQILLAFVGEKFDIQGGMALSKKDTDINTSS